MKKFLVVALLLFFISGSSNLAKAQNYQLHAVFINSFIKYVKWPANRSDGNFKIGVLGDSPLIEHLNKLAEVKKVDGRTIVVEKYSSLDDAAGAHMLYIPSGESSQVESAISKLRSSSTLIITEVEGLGEKGSNINFVNKNGRLAFELNLSAMEKSQLRVATELARLAIEI